MGKLAGKCAIVTGAGQGVGQGIAFALASEGCDVVVSGRTEAKLADTVAGVEERGANAVAIGCDVLNPDDIAATVQLARDSFGRIDVLVNNAQMVPLGKLLKLNEDDVNNGWQSGPMATLRFMRACFEDLKASKGSIINLASSSAFRWDASGYGAYGAVKEGIRQLTRAAAGEWGKHGIRANVILPLALSPGMKMWTEYHPEEAAAFVNTVPLGYVGDCEQDIGKTVAWLASDEARYITAQSIGVDGGQARLV